MIVSSPTFREVWSRDGLKARIYYQSYGGVQVKTLVVDLASERPVLSTMHGLVRARYLCNNYSPPELWDSLHKHDFRENYYKYLMSEVGVSGGFACLGTGVDMDDLAIATAEFRDVWVTVFATAGVETNAMRAGYDRAQVYEIDGRFEHVGTINVILVTNASLTEAAMARAIITATEAKCAALQDLGVKSSYSPDVTATGTGTDNVMIASGNGVRVTYTGGHSKAGELISYTVYKSVRDALLKHRERLYGRPS